MVQVRVAVLTMWTEVTTIDLGEVVRVELEQSPDHRLVIFERWNGVAPGSRTGLVCGDHAAPVVP